MSNKKISINYKEPFNPNWFLKALGNGGLSVSFFMYLMFFIKHKTPIPIFSDLSKELTPLTFKSIIILADLGIILYFGVRFYYEFFVQMDRFLKYKKTNEYKKMLGTNSEISLMTIPLTMAMGINVLFILGAVYVPHLWDYVEYLFPIAIIAFLIVGIYGIKIFITYFNNTLAIGNFDFIKNNNLSQMIAPFAFVMVSVGLAAPMAMSQNIATNLTALILSIFFMVITLILVNFKLILGIKSIFKNGVDVLSAPTLWITIPIMTLIGITGVRLISGISHHIIETETNLVVIFVLLTVLVSIQIVFGIIGYSFMKKNGYFEEYVKGDKFHVGSYSLICPGVAFMVLGMFFVNYGFVKTGYIAQFSYGHLFLTLPFVVIQIITVITLGRLNRKSRSVKF